MDAVVKTLSPDEPEHQTERPSRTEVEAAVRTLIAWTGDNPDREGLIDTPMRVTKALEEFYSGYDQDPYKILERTFNDVAGYQDMVLVRDIPFHSHCEHHMVPFFGSAHIAYYPTDGVVGLSKLARLVDAFARCRRDDRGGAYVHVDARRAQIRLVDDDVPLHRHLPERSLRAREIPPPRSRLLISQGRIPAPSSKGPA
jgi:hypothetical protein